MKKKDGFVLLYALLVASVVAIGGALLSDIILKQIILSGVSRDSQVAYYAAQSGEQCVHYWSRDSVFGSYEENPFTGEIVYRPPLTPVPVIECNSTPIEVEVDADSNFYRFSFVLTNLPNNSCAVVELIRYLDGSQEFSRSLGYNFGDDICEGTSIRRVERQIIRSYLFEV